MTAAGQVRAWFTTHGRSLGAGALVLAALAVGRVVDSGLPKADEVGTRPIERAVPVETTAHLRVGDVTVTGVTGGRTWAGVADAKLTKGIWVVAAIDFVPHEPSAGIAAATVRSGDYAWRMGRGTTTCAGGIVGVPMQCQVVVEVPERAIPDAELVLRWNKVDDRWDDQAVVPLDLSAATVRRYAAVTEPIKVPLARVGTR